MKLSADRAKNPWGVMNPDQVLAKAVRFMTAVGMAIPLTYVIPILLEDVSPYFGRVSLLTWTNDLALLASLPWELVAMLLIVLRWRDLPQRFWILFCVNGFLAYAALPVYRMHFGLY